MSALEHVMASMRAGDTVQAERLAAEAAEASRRCGDVSEERAAALDVLAAVQMSAGNPRSAIATYRAALDAVPTHDARQRLTSLVTLAEAHEQLGEYDEALALLRESVEGRRVFYGEEHAGYGFGVEPLARVLLARGDHPEARDLALVAMQNLIRAGHERAATSIVLFVAASAALGMNEKLSFSSLPESVLVAMGAHAIEFTAGPIAARLSMLEYVRAVLARHLGAAAGPTLEVTNAMANLARDGGDAETRLRALHLLGEAFDAAGDRGQRARVAQAMALALSEGGRTLEADAAYADARDRAEALGDGILCASVARNYALHLAHTHRREDAGPMFREAISLASRVNAEHERGLTEIAYGISLQHEERFDEALLQLEAGLARVPAEHPHALAGRAHLQAIAVRRSCGCGDMNAVLVDRLRARILEQVPPGLVDRLEIELVSGEDLRVAPHLAREPLDGELAHLERVVAHALHGLRERVGERAG